MTVFSNNSRNKNSSEKSFGIVFSIVFLLVSIYPLIHSGKMHIWALFVSSMFMFLAYVSPKLLSLPSKLWLKFGLLIGSIVSPIFISVIYYIAVVPTGLIMRLLGKDILKNKLDDNAETYWIKRKEPIGSMKNQF